jgi:formylglycine-generating enzyme
VKTSTAHCGACGQACSTSNVVSTSCSGGACNGACVTGFADCDGNKLSNGCEIDLMSSAANCGVCGQDCSSNNMATVSCGSGSCNGTCSAGFADCDKNKKTNGCEIDTLTNAENCGGCTKACSTSNMDTVTCAAGACNGNCKSGFGDCDDDKLSNGCETNTGTSAAHCGGCGKACSTSNMSTVTCGGGLCNGACSTGFVDCDGNKLTNGCEVDTRITVTDCGGCKKACSSSHMLTVTCNDGACNGACATGFADCDKNKLTNGCEIDLSNDSSNCGTCGNVCPGGQACMGGQCKALPLSCQTSGAGRSDCGASGAETCCGHLPVTGGAYKRSYDGVSYTDATYPATVSDFRLDKYEITVGRFRQFIAAWVGGWRPAAGAGKHVHLNSGSGLVNVGTGGGYEPGWDTNWASQLSATTSGWDTNLACTTGTTWTSTAGANERMPINCLFWYDAAAFCIWDGAFLPSEAEWNHASTGGSDQRVYPWSSPANSTTIDATYAVFGVGSAALVGSKPKGEGRYGQLDLGGNMGEWVLDWNATYVNPCVDCAYTTVTTNRILRGGFYGNVDTATVTSSRPGGLPYQRNHSRGARCARVP